MNESIDHRLQQHYSQFDQDHDRLRNELLARMASSVQESGKPCLRHRAIQIAAGLAACLCLGWLLWSIMSPSTSWAEVAAAIDKQAWVHVRFDDGEERWMSFQGPRYSARKTPDWIAFSDYSANQDYYKFPQSDYIGLSALYPSDEAAKKNRLERLPKTPLDYVGIDLKNVSEGNASEEQKKEKSYVERHAETVDGRDMLRFDIYQKDVLDRTFLWQQIWVDPLTRLPVWIRSRLQLADRKKEKREYIVGEYEFPASGPTEIYALGLSRDLPVVRTDQPPPQGVEEIIKAAAKARQAFPDRFRSIIWPADEPDVVDVLWWDGESFRGEGIKRDDRGVKIRFEHYFNLDPNDGEEYEPYYLPLPATAEEALAWTETQVPVTTNVSDGKLAVRKVGPYPSVIVNASDVSVRVLGIRNIVLFNSFNWPSMYQWPFVNHVGPFELVHDAPDAEPGIVVLRREAGDERTDYYIDPAHDYLCTKQLEWEKRSDAWRRQREYAYLDLAQLEGGQWYARKRVQKSYPDPIRKRRGNQSVDNIDITLLEPDQFPPDAFNVEKILEQARADGLRIESY